MKKKETISSKDLKTWEDYTKNPTNIFDKDINSPKKFNYHVRFRFDLHGYTLVEANQKVQEIILSCFEKKYKEILLITGKGMHSNTDKNIYQSKNLSKLRYSIPDYINSEIELSSKISDISVAELKDGGEGALILKLKNL